MGEDTVKLESCYLVNKLLICNNLDCTRLNFWESLLIRWKKVRIHLKNILPSDTNTAFVQIFGNKMTFKLRRGKFPKCLSSRSSLLLYTIWKITSFTLLFLPSSQYKYLFLMFGGKQKYLNFYFDFFFKVVSGIKTPWD